MAATSVLPASAATSQTIFVTESFTMADVSGYIRPSAPAGANSACLTASSDTSETPIPGCSATTSDPAASGALRLTSAANTLEGGIGATQSVPISKGLDASFDSYQYGGTGADGIAFYLAVTDPYNPRVPTAIGQAGGSLGYSPTGTSPGLAHGYLGLGLDVYGNYLNSNFDGSGCSSAPGNATQPTNVAVRGPGSGSNGYCVLPGYNSSLGGKSALHSTTRANSQVPVEVVINPSTSSTTSAGTSALSAITVPATSYAIVFKTLGATSQTVVRGTLPDLRATKYAGLVDPAWYSPDTGLPYKLTYGWVASTGGSTDVHEVNYLDVRTLNGPVPELAAVSTVSTATPQHGAQATYTVTPSVSAAGGTETAPVRITSTFPAGITPDAYTGTDYTCTIAGQTETCEYSGTTAAGASLPALTLPFTAAGDASTSPRSISSVTASTDATAVTSAASVTISKIPTTTAVTMSPAAPTYGGSETFTATVSVATATGTVAFVDTTTGATLCAAVTVSAGVATCTTTAGGPTGQHTVTATYSGDVNTAASAGSITASTQPIAVAITASASPAEIEFGSSSTLTAAGIPAGAGGTVTFTDADGGTLCTTAAGSRSCATSGTLGAGSYAVTAGYSGDASHASAASTNETTLVVDRMTATITDTVNGSSSGSVVFGEPATLATQGLAPDATGTIAYTTADGSTLCTATLPATGCTTSGALDAGDYSVTATYSGDADHAGAATLVPARLTVTKATVAIAASVNGSTAASVAFGTPANLDVSGLPAGATGTITFTDAAGTAVCTADVSALPCATPASLGAGGHAVTAGWNGDANHTSATSPAVTLTVTKATASLTATVNGGPNATTIYGTPATLDSTGLAATATGRIEYREGATVLCTATLPAATTCDAPATLASAVHDITAHYLGDDNHASATSPAVTLTVAKASPVLTDTVDGDTAATVDYGTPATLDAAGIPAGVDGIVQYIDQNGAVLCQATLPTTSCTTDADLPVARYDVSATWQGDANFDPATTAVAATLAVERAAATALASTVDGRPAATITHGDTATLDSTGVPADATGTISYTVPSYALRSSGFQAATAGSDAEEGTVLCVATLPSTTCATSRDLPGGTYAVQAQLSGDANHLPSTGPTVTLTVSPQASAIAATVAASAHSGAAGTTITATGTPDGATGTLTFTSNGKVLCVVALPRASCTTTDLGPGEHAIVVSYSGDASYAASRTTITVTVAAPAAALAATGSTVPVAGMLGAATALLALGMLLMVLARRRRRSDPAS